MKTSVNLDSAQHLLAIRIPGDLTSTTVPSVLVDLESVLGPPAGQAPGWETLTLDLSSARKVDSVGLNLVVTIFKAAKAVGARMRLTYSDPNVHRTLVFTRLDRHLELVRA